MVIIGFIALLIIVAGLVFGYMEYIHTKTADNDFSYKLLEGINEQNKTINNIKSENDNLIKINDCFKKSTIYRYNECLK